MLAPFTGHLYSTTDIRNPRQGQRQRMGLQYRKREQGREAVRIQMLETLERDVLINYCLSCT
jgi:hypothetical protein